jgi:HlyD family secretion protein
MPSTRTGLSTPTIGASALALGILLLVTGCGTQEVPDAHGNFEAEPVTVSSEQTGRLLRFSVREGDRLPAGTVDAGPVGTGLQTPELRSPTPVVGLVDTTQRSLQRRELTARRQSLASRRRTVAAEIDVLQEQLRAAERERERMRTLRAGDAASARQVDRATDEVRILERRIEATETQRESLGDEIRAVTEQIAQINERIRKSWVVNPVQGTVLATYAERGEFVRSGEPLYKIASLDTLTLRAYVSGAQLADVRLGQPARVHYDTSRTGQATRTGRVTWVASEAEFTPTPIQTREERVDYVYAVEIRVPNPDGALKIGMPADVSFHSSDSADSPPTATRGRGDGT